MKIALASAPVSSGDVAHNLTQMAKFISEAKKQGADLVCFGEAYLQGFDALSWTAEEDRSVALSCRSGLFQVIGGWSKDSGIDVLFGYYEKEGENLYSSCALVSGGVLALNYRRISKGWKDPSKADAHYREGEELALFRYRDRLCSIALCGDLWDYPETFALGQDVTIWPVYVNYTAEEWNTFARQEYAAQAANVGGTVLMINPVDQSAQGGSACFRNGAVIDALPVGEEGLLLVEV